MVKKIFPNKENITKEMGKNSSEYSFITFLPTSRMSLRKLKKLYSKEKFKFFKQFMDKYRQYFEFWFYRAEFSDISISLTKTELSIK